MGIKTGAGATGIGTHAGTAVPEALEEATTIGVRVRIISFYFALRNSLEVERDRRDYRYDDRRDSDRRDRDDRRRDERRDDRDRHRDDPRERDVPPNPEAKPGLKEESGNYWSPATPWDANSGIKSPRFQNHACRAKVSRMTRKRESPWMP